MEPIDSDLEYPVHERREVDPGKRFNWLYILPGLGALWLLYLVVSVVFQLPVTEVVDPVMSFMIVLFFIFVGLLFWAMAPRVHRH